MYTTLHFIFYNILILKLFAYIAYVQLLAATLKNQFDDILLYD